MSEFGAIQLRESGDSLDRSSTFEYRFLWRDDSGEILDRTEWVVTNINSRIETRPGVRKYDQAGAEAVYKMAEPGLNEFIEAHK